MPTDEPAPNEPNSGRPVKRKSAVAIDVRTLLALTACCGVVLWSWRTVVDIDPIRAAARKLTTGEEPDRLIAVAMLGEASPDEFDPAWDPLRDATRDPSARVRLSAVDGVVRLLRVYSGGPFPAGFRTRAPDMLRRRVVEAVETLLDRLNDPDASVRGAAASAAGKVVGLRGLPPLAAPKSAVYKPGPSDLDITRSMSRLVESLDDPDERARLGAVESLGEFGKISDATPPAALLERLSDDAVAVRQAASRSVLKFEHGTERTIPRVMTLLDDPSMEVRQSALPSLCGTPGVPASLSPFLVERLASPNPHVRAAAAGLLRNSEAADPDVVVPALIEAIKRAIREKRDEDASRLLASAAVEVDPSLYMASALASRYSRSDLLPKTLAPWLADVLQHSDSLNERVGVARVLARVGQPLRSALPVVLERLAVDSDVVSSRALVNSAVALAKGTPDGPTAGLALRKFFEKFKADDRNWSPVERDRLLSQLRDVPDTPDDDKPVPAAR